MTTKGKFSASAARFCLLVQALCFAAAGCDRDVSRESLVRPNALTRGDRVVVEATAAEFFEGRILAIDDAGVRVLSADEGEPKRVALGDVYRLTPASTRFTAGDAAICNASPKHWSACLIEGVHGAEIIALTSDGQRLTLVSEQLLAPTALTALNVRRRFERAYRKQRFLALVTKAGDPRAPAGWQATGGARVVALRGSAWLSARVREIADEGIYVEWAADQRVTTVDRKNVVPEPPYRRALGRGDVALLRPDAPSQPWRPVHVVAGRGDLTVEHADGERETAGARDLLPLGP
jgi:hypothetical protein